MSLGSEQQMVVFSAEITLKSVRENLTVAMTGEELTSDSGHKLYHILHLLESAEALLKSIPPAEADD